MAAIAKNRKKKQQQQQQKRPLNIISSVAGGLISKVFHRIVPLMALYQNYSNGSAPLNKMAARAKNRKQKTTTTKK